MARSTLPQYVQMTKGGTPSRMAALRIAASTWRGARHCGFNDAESFVAILSPGMNGRAPVWSHHGGAYFRNERDASDIVRTLPNGWYSNTDRTETVIGIVSSLSHGRFIAGYRWTSNDERVYYGKVYDDEDEAARAADSHAEMYGETCLEDSERFDECQNLQHEVAGLQDEVAIGYALRNHDSLSNRDAIGEKIERIREIRASLENDFSEYL